MRQYFEAWLCPWMHSKQDSWWDWAWFRFSCWIIDSPQSPLRKWTFSRPVFQNLISLLIAIAPIGLMPSAGICMDYWACITGSHAGLASCFFEVACIFGKNAGLQVLKMWGTVWKWPIYAPTSPHIYMWKWQFSVAIYAKIAVFFFKKNKMLTSKKSYPNRRWSPGSCICCVCI